MDRSQILAGVDNPNFSRSLLYENAIMDQYRAGNELPPFRKLTTSLYFVNGWDTFVDNNNGKTVGYQFNWAVADTTHFIVNGSHGPEQTVTTATTAISGILF